MATTFYLHELKGGASTGSSSPTDYAVFRPVYAPYQQSGEPSLGEFKIRTPDWIKRGRPVSIEIGVPAVPSPLEEALNA